MSIKSPKKGLENILVLTGDRWVSTPMGLERPLGQDPNEVRREEQGSKKGSKLAHTYAYLYTNMHMK